MVQQIFQEQKPKTFFKKICEFKKLEDEAIENIKEEYGFEEINNAFDEASVPEHFEFFYGGNNKNFVRACYFLSLNKDNNEFISFLCSDN